ncbi:MAG: amidohydrolase family protein [Acidimicrobiia bacterium]|nr:amidohydrolase family protein [Acidimicrobiia bacterium]
MLDLAIRGGTIVDGSGSPARRGDVGIRDGRIAAVGRLDEPAARVIDAGGLLVTPGWVDVHTHYDGQVTWDALLTPSCWHGVTTVVMGNCGVGFAPVRPGSHDYLIKLMEGVEDIPGTALAEGIDWSWESFPEYLDAIERKAHALDVGAQVPHGALRFYVMGERGADHTQAPSDREIEEMGRLVREALRAGALGFSTSRTKNHRTSDGRYTPSLTAGEAELVGISHAVGQSGRGVFEVVSDFVGGEGEWALFRRMVETSGRPMSISLAQSDASPEGWRRALASLDDANAQGLPMKAQVATRAIGVLLGYEATLNPFASHPSYQQVAGLPLADRVARLRDPELRRRVLAERPAPALAFLVAQFDRIFVLGDPPDYEPPADASIAAEAARRGVRPEALAYDLLLEDGGRALLYRPLLNYSGYSLDAVREMLLHEHTVPGLGDAGAHCGLICDGSFPTYLLGYWGRARTRGERLPLEWLVKSQTADTAALVGLCDRGRIAPSLKADLNLIELDQLGLRHPEIVHDLPAGGKRLVQRATGYRATIQSGEVTFEDGEPTGALPGRLVRGPQAAV